MTLANEPPFDTQALLEEIRSWVEIESPSRDADAVNRAMDLAQATAAGAGARVERIPGSEGRGDHLLITSPWGDETTPGVLLLSHLDTVHAIGTLAGPAPFKVEGDVAWGPGIYDMKGGALIALAALRHLIATGQTTPLPIRHLIVSDEEIGSGTGRAHIEREARRARFVLVTEPAREGGRIVTGRKGTAMFRLEVKGRAAHAGTRHQDGRSAVKELARQILAIEAMTDYATGLTLNVGTIGGGSGTNVVPQEAWANIDMRVPNQAIAEAAIARLQALTPHDPDVTLTVTGALNRPGFEKTPAIAQLLAHAQGLAAEIGFDLQDLSTGGGSDGNFTAAMGVPTLDGLGVDGKAAHTHDEQLYISSIVPRAMLLLRLMQTLD
ncbi:M20 family metallopeptidase [Roseomonas sp. 18066]|uniref:M20 family metallopeptidase n=1 Tax=Roseomonas sp. 18066 TaxID=2681412 RepID=UPI00135869E6|nr:M20 family metallopeptidase [Roseomonas sp. 18066]